MGWVSYMDFLSFFSVTFASRKENEEEERKTDGSEGFIGGVSMGIFL